MNESKSCEYNPKEFRKFLEGQMHIKPGSAYSYVSYVNKASQLLGKEIRKLATPPFGTRLLRIHTATSP